MRVLVLSRRGIAKAFTGDSTQMRKTMAGVRERVDQVSQVFVDNDGALFDADDAPVAESMQSLCARHDVVHELPRLNFRAHRAIETILATVPVAISTVYWHDFTRILIAWRNDRGHGNRWLSAVRAWRAGRRRLQDYRRGCDVLLPNSWAEGQNVRRHFSLSRAAVVVPVPNAIVAPPFDVDALARPADIPFADYVVCPAVFAPRKNQLGLIKAMRGSAIPLVFMGDPLRKGAWYDAECRRLAGPNMLFLGHKPSDSPAFWSVLRHARCACLPSDCETPGIALLEAALAGARPVITLRGGTQEYYGFCAEYLDPVWKASIRAAVERGWARGRLSAQERQSFRRFSWEWAAEVTVNAYQTAIVVHRNGGRCAI